MLAEAPRIAGRLAPRTLGYGAGVGGDRLPHLLEFSLLPFPFLSFCFRRALHLRSPNRNWDSAASVAARQGEAPGQNEREDFPLRTSWKARTRAGAPLRGRTAKTSEVRSRLERLFDLGPILYDLAKQSAATAFLGFTSPP